MHVISRPAIIAAARRHSDAATWLDRWWADACTARWESLHDVRINYPAADQFGNCLIFNARGNKYRLICRVSYANAWQRGTVFVKHFLTHAEYDKEDWKEDCKS